MDEISLLDKQIGMLYDYKSIPEHEVKALCEKVSNKKTLLTPFIYTGQGNPLE